MARDVVLERYQNKLKDLEIQHQNVVKRQRGAIGRIDPQLEQQLEEIEAEMEIWTQRIEERQAQNQRDTAQMMLDQLLQILEMKAEEITLMVNICQRIFRIRKFRFEADLMEGRDILVALSKVPPSQRFYDARDEFVARLIYVSEDPVLIDSLKQWQQTYRLDVDWAALADAIAQSEQDLEEESRTAQTALLIKIDLAEQSTTQAQEELYRLSAWWIGNRQTNNSPIPLLDPENDPEHKTDSGPFSLEEIPNQIPTLFNAFIEQLNDSSDDGNSASGERSPEVHVFLPLLLLNTSTNLWLLRAGRRPQFLDTRYDLFLHCSDRYQRNYDGSRWRALWRHCTSSMELQAKDVFVEGDDSDLDELEYELESQLEGCERCQEHQLVGLKLTAAPGTAEEEGGIFQVLLDSGLPLGLWGRCDLSGGNYKEQLDNLFNQEDCQLKQLSAVVKRKRREARRRDNTPTCHIGHHLALLWDDPNIAPPRSA